MAGLNEDKAMRVNRELTELLNELRVALPGAQVLFGFLLTVPFQRGFVDATKLQRSMFFGVLIATTLSTVMFIAPSTYHRICFRKPDKERLLFTANLMLLLGTVFLAFAIVGVVFLVTTFVATTDVAAATSALVAVVVAALWYGLPVVRRLRGEHAHEDRP
jgi:hypothetical protein